MIDWIKSHWLFCIFAGVVLILVIVLICIVAYQRKKERELDERPKRLVIKRNNLDKKQEENLKISKPIIKENLRTGEKVKRNVKIKEQQEGQILENKEIEEKQKEKPKKEKKQVEKTQNVKENENLEQTKEKEEKEQVKKVEKRPAKKTETKKVEEKKPVKKAESKKVEEKKPAKKVESKKVEEKESETYRVVYDKEQRNWIVKIDGGERASKRCATKEEALKVAKDLAKKKDADLSIHKKNGKFQKQ